MVEQITIHRPAQQDDHRQIVFTTTGLEPFQPVVERIIKNAPPGQLDILEGKAVADMQMQVEHEAEQGERNHPQRQQHPPGAIAKAQQLPPAVGLQRQDHHREHHHHSQVARGSHQGACHTDPEPATPIGAQKYRQGKQQETRLGIGGDEVDGKGREGQQPDAKTRGLQILPQLAQTQEEQRQGKEKRQIGQQIERIESANPQQLSDPVTGHREAG